MVVYWIYKRGAPRPMVFECLNVVFDYKTEVEFFGV